MKWTEIRDQEIFSQADPCDRLTWSGVSRP